MIYSFKTKALMMGSLLIFSTQVLGHAGYQPKDVMDAYDGRAYKENSTAYLSLTVPHGCRDEAENTYPTRHIGLLLPTMVSLSTEQGYTEDRDGKHYGANAMMGIRTAIDSNWGVIRQLNGEVSEYYSHGAKTTDVKAIHWLNGYLPYEMYAALKFRATFPKLSGCLTKMRVYTPVIQYCDNEQYLVWNKAPTTAFPEEKVSLGYTPYFDVVREIANNPLAETCEKEETWEAYPADDAIDWYLSPRETY